MLTAGIDSVTGTSGNDTIIGNNADGKALTLSSFDQINGGAGVDTLQISLAGAIDTTALLNTSIQGVEVARLVSATGAITTNTTQWAGLQTLQTTNSGAAQTVTAAATTDVTATVGAQADNNIAVTGGKNVSVTATGVVVGTTTVTNAAGEVTVSSTGAAMADGAEATKQTQGLITVTGGTKVNVSSLGSVTGGSNDAGDALTLSAVTVNGGANTAEVTVTQTAAQTRVAGADGRAAIVNGAVTITDANAVTAAADTIATVTLNNYANSTVQSGALSTLNLSGTAGTLGVNTTVEGANQTATTLALNLNGLSGTNTLTLGSASGNSSYTTVNLNASTAASNLANIASAGTAITALNISGDAALTLGNQAGLAATAAIVSTNSAGVTLSTALGTTQSFTGGAGNDTITLGANHNTNITMGAGDDTVIYGGALAATRTVSAGEGRDTIQMTSAQANAASGSAVFNNTFSGFEVLRVSDQLASTVNLVGINGVSNVVLAAGANAGALNGLASGGTVRYLGGGSGDLTVNVANAVFSTTDVLNVELANTTSTNFDTLNAADVETVNISAADAAAAGSAAVVHSLTLNAAAATTIRVSGNNGLDLTGSTSTAVTLFDASGVVGNGTADTAANLAVIFVSGNNTANASVTIKGGAGNDALTGNAANDTFDLTAGGSDTVTFQATRALNGLDTVLGFTAGNVSATGQADVLNLAAGGAVVLQDANGGADGLIFNTATATADLVFGGVGGIAANSAVQIITGTATLDTSMVRTASTAQNGELIVGDNTTTFVLQAAAANSTSFRLYRVFDADNDINAVSASVELIGVVNMTNTFGDIVAANIS